MAKQASNKTQTKQEKMAMVFMPIKSPTTGAYTFKKSIVPNDKVLELLAKK